jgi:4-amino-4-deoxy-L-arabinose transferase-like glycosyltransferase
MLFLGIGFRFHALAQDIRFHPDEALFSTFARSAAVNGDWLLHGPLDKTPLTIYASALSMTFFGVHTLPNGVLDLDSHMGEFAARLPGAFASILLVAVMYRLPRDIYPARGIGTRHVVSVVTMGLMATSPLAIAFSATVFTDGLMLLFLALSLLMIARGRWGLSGIFLALGFASKQQALYYAPLIEALGWAVDSSKRRGASRSAPTNALRKISVFALPTLVTLALLLVWDGLRAQSGGIWGLAAANNNPGRFIRSNEILPRLLLWAGDVQTLAGPGWLTALLALLGTASLLWRLIGEPRCRATLVDMILATYLLIYGWAHWLVAFNTYDRYLLPVLPIVLLLMARGVGWMKDLTQRRKDAKTQRMFLLTRPFVLCISVLSIVALASAALDASEGRIHVGGDLGEHSGIDALANYLNSRALGAIVYDHWLGWELGYYMGSWSDKRRVYYPTPEALAADALLQPDPAPRYFPAPADQPITPWLEALDKAGFAVKLAYDTPQFVVYELMPP